jgi:hypothetical protein
MEPALYPCVDNFVVYYVRSFGTAIGIKYVNLLLIKLTAYSVQ